MKKNNIDRRKFLTQSGLGALGFLAMTSLPMGMGRFKNLLAPEAQAAQANETLIYIFCRGGLDALSLFPPVQSDLRARYLAARPNSSFEAKVLKDRNGNVCPFGVNSQLQGLADLWNEKKMAVVFGAGSVTNTTSHFNQMSYIEGGSCRRRLSQGIFQRVKDQAGWADKMDLVAIEDLVPAAMKGQNFVLQYNRNSELAALKGPVTPGLDKAERLENNYQSIGGIRTVAQALSSVSRDIYPQLQKVDVSSSIPYENFQEIARLMKIGVAPRIIATSIGGWDFHTDIRSRFAESSALFSESLAGLVKELEVAGKLASTTIVVMSEFGRRIIENGAKGADHGRGGVMMVIGDSSRIKGAKMVVRPDLVNRMVSQYGLTGTPLKQAQIPVDYDYRLVLGEILQKRFGLSPVQVRGSETAVFLEDYLNTSSIISNIDTINPSSSGLYAGYRPVDRLSEIAALFAA